MEENVLIGSTPEKICWERKNRERLRRTADSMARQLMRRHNGKAPLSEKLPFRERSYETRVSTQWNATHLSGMPDHIYSFP